MATAIRSKERAIWKIAQSRNLAHEPSWYARHNMMATTAGVCSDEALRGAQAAIGSSG